MLLADHANFKYPHINVDGGVWQVYALLCGCVFVCVYVRV